MKLTLKFRSLSYPKGKTTKEVGSDLEKRYGILRQFIKNNGRFISREVKLSIIRTGLYKRGEVLNRIQDKFRRDIEARVYDNVLKDVPTLRSGGSRVTKAGKLVRVLKGARPSFDDTGRYKRSLLARIDK